MLQDAGHQDAIARLEDVLTTEQLRERPYREPDYERESKGLAVLAQAMADSPESILQRLTEVVMEALGAGSAGISLLSQTEAGPRFHWPAIAGAWKPFVGGGLPYDASPCGVVVDQSAVQLFTLPERHFTYMNEIEHPIEEALLVPFFTGGSAIGTVWAVAHDPSRKFDSEDARLLTTLSRFAAAAHQVWRSGEDAVKVKGALKESEDRFHHLANQVMLWMTEPDGFCTYLSESWRRATGQEEEEGLGFGWLDAVHPDDRPAAKHAFDEANRKGGQYRAEYRLRQRDDSYRWAIDTGQPRFDDAGRFLGYIGSVVDINERKRAEQALLEGEEWLRVATAAARLGLHNYNVGAGTVQWDQRTRELWGIGPDEPITYELWRDSLHPDDREQAEQAVRSALDPEGDGQCLAQYRVTSRADGGTRWIEATGRTTFEGGEPVRLVGTVQDISERKKAEEALREADRHKDEFLATLAHELRNPLAAIRMALGVLGRADQSAEQLEQMRAIIDRQSAQLVRLIDDLLDVSRVSRGKIELHLSEVDLAMVIEHAIEGVRESCASKELRFEVQMPKEPIVVNADAFRLAQVLSNLLSNSCKFTNEGGVVRLAASREGRSAVVRVTDTGVGIPSGELPRIFDMFAQVDGAGRSAGAGLGIGLALAKSIITLHGGTIEARSAGANQGSEFTVRLPARDANAPTSPPASAREDSPQLPGRPRRILAVDDNVDALSAIEAILKAGGHEVHTATGGAEAIEKARTKRPDVVLLDIGLPDMEGYDVAKQIRRAAGGWGSDMLLIALTGWGQAKDRQRSADAGFDAHLTKPADPEALERLIREGGATVAS